MSTVIVCRMQAMLHKYMETAMVVMEAFQNLYDKLDKDKIYSETDIDTYDSLYDIAIQIEDYNQRSGDELCIGEIREMAEERILEEYGLEENKTYVVIETQGKDEAKTIGVFNYRYEAENLRDKENSERRWILEQ